MNNVVKLYNTLHATIHVCDVIKMNQNLEYWFESIAKQSR